MGVMSISSGLQRNALIGDWTIGTDVRCLCLFGGAVLHKWIQSESLRDSAQDMLRTAGFQRGRRLGKAIGAEECLKRSKAIRAQRRNDLTEEEITDREKVSKGPTPESRGRPKRRLKTMIIGVGVVLVIIGIALAVYVATYEDESFLIALGPAFIGVIVIIAALFGKKL